MYPEVSPSFFLIGASHAIALLDAATDWRTQRRAQQSGPVDTRYAEDYQEWLSGTTPDSPFTTTVNSVLPSRTGAATVWLRTAASKPLLTIRPMPDKSVTFLINSPFDLHLEKWRGQVPIVSMLGSNQHSRHVIRTQPDYDFLEMGVPEIAHDAQMVDSFFIDSQVMPWVNAVALPLLSVYRSVENPLCHVLSPPPRANPQATPHLEVFKELLERHGFAPDRLRLKWYRRYCRLLSQQLRQFGIEVLPPPVETVGSDGLLLEHFAEGLTHGNALYGACVARQVSNWLADAQPRRL